MIPAMPEDETGGGLPGFKPKHIGIVAVVIVVAGIIGAFLAGQGIIPVNPGLVLGSTILFATLIVCCASSLLITSFASKMPEYGEMEIKYREGMDLYEDEEYEKAIPVFLELAGPKLDHKRALFYAAKSYEALDDWENVKKYTKAYLEMKPKDKEAWEMLTSAHKRLFEYEDAEEAQSKADSI
jgi:hypothetical protein